MRAPQAMWQAEEVSHGHRRDTRSLRPTERRCQSQPLIQPSIERRPSRKCPRPALRAAAVNARRTGTRLTRTPGAALTAVSTVPCWKRDGRRRDPRPGPRLIGDQISVPIMVMIARGSAHTSAAHTADNREPHSRTCHAARHDVNDPHYERGGHLRLVAPGSLTSWRAVPFPRQRLRRAAQSAARWRLRAPINDWARYELSQ